MGLADFLKDMRVPTGYRDHLIDSSALAWVFYERHHPGRLKSVVPISRRKDARKKRGKALDITGCMVRNGAADGMGNAGFARKPSSVHHFLSLLTGLAAAFTDRPIRSNHRLRSS